MKRYLVTGGAGFIGSAITNKLLQDGHFVRVVDNEFRGNEISIKKSARLEFIKSDIRDSEKIIDACRDIDSIIHLAYINGTKYFYEKPDLVLDVGVKGMLNVLEGAKINKIEELFLASSSEVYQTPPIIPTPETVPYSIPDPLNPRYSYAGGKIISEMMSLFIGEKIFKKVIIFRPHNVYGPNMGTEHVIPELIKKILIEKRQQANKITLPIQGDGKQTRSFIYIDDFVDAVMILLKKTKTNEIYNIGTTEEITINTLISLLGKIAETTIQTKYEKLPPGATNRRCPDIKKIEKLGFESKIQLFEGLKKTYIWYNKNLFI
jgi:nucleoside-diphosphate-sugar epimerase